MSGCDSVTRTPWLGERRRVVRKRVYQFVRDEKGMETVEWRVLAALMVSGLIAVLAGLGANPKAKLTILQTATS